MKHLLAAAVLLAVCTSTLLLVEAQGNGPQVTTYQDSNCVTVAATYNVTNPGVCYQGAIADFIVLEFNDEENENRAWTAVQEYDTHGCTGDAIVTSVMFGNLCREAGPGFYVAQLPTDATFMYVYSNCVDNYCRGCRTNATLSPTGCAFVDGRGRYVRSTNGVGSGSFQAQFFRSNDGTCRGPSTTSWVPDGACGGDYGVQFASTD